MSVPAPAREEAEASTWIMLRFQYEYPMSMAKAATTRKTGSSNAKTTAMMPVDPVTRAQFRLALYRLEHDWYELAGEIVALGDGVTVVINGDGFFNAGGVLGEIGVAHSQ